MCNVADSNPSVVDRMRHLIDLRQPSDQTNRPPPEGSIDPELAEKLRALGYAVDSPDS
jgi:hypothetical protein